MTTQRWFRLMAATVLLALSFVLTNAQETVTIRWWTIYTNPPELAPFAS